MDLATLRISRRKRIGHSDRFCVFIEILVVQFIACLSVVHGQTGAEQSTLGAEPIPEQVLEAYARPLTRFKPSRVGGSERTFPPPEVPALHLRGRIDADSLWAEQSASNRDTYGAFSDVTALRRARIGVAGELTPEIAYIGEIDLATGQVVIKDAYFDRSGRSSDNQFKVGHMREPFSLEGGTSANSFAFLERSPINLLDPARNWGVGLAHCGPEERFTFIAGLFQSGTDPSDLEYGEGSMTAVTARWTELAYYQGEGSQLVHWGVAISGRIPNDGLVVVRQRPSSPLIELGDSSDSPFVPKLDVPAVFQQLMNLQFAVVHGAIWAQSEWYGSVICQPQGSALFFHGSYLDAGWFLTGEHRGYLKRAGVFGPVTVSRPAIRGFSSGSEPESLGYGAWELTGRVSYLDLASSASTADPGQPVGTRMPQITIGLNWYLADRLRILANSTYSVPVDSVAGQSEAGMFGVRLGTFW